MLTSIQANKRVSCRPVTGSRFRDRLVAITSEIPWGTRTLRDHELRAEAGQGSSSGWEEFASSGNIRTRASV